MICDDVAEYVSALCDGQTIPSSAAQHIAHCPDCQFRLSDYLALSAELRRAASLELSNEVPSRNWTRSQNRIRVWWQKGLSTMRIPRLAFAALIVGIFALSSALTVIKARAHNTGTVVLLSVAGLGDVPLDCPLSIVDKNYTTCSGLGRIGLQFLGYKIELLSHDGDRVLLAIRTRTYPIVFGEAKSFSPFELDRDPAKQVWFTPGEPLKFELPGGGALTFKGDWLDHMPVLGLHKEDLSPGPNEVRFASPLLLKDGSVVGDLKGAIGGLFAYDDRDWAIQTYFPGEGRFLISQLPIKDAVEARVMFSRISFRDGGHSWEFVTGAPVSQAEKIWVLHQTDFKMPGLNSPSVGNVKLVETQPGVWVPQDMNN